MSTPRSAASTADRIGWATVTLLVGGAGGAAALAATAPDRAAAAAQQEWAPFVLVAGLIVVGSVAEEDGLFAVAGRWLGSLARSGAARLAGLAVLVAVVTALLNLDTSVAFLTPVAVYAAEEHGASPLVYATVLLSNAASLLLPGSNLTNLIVLGDLHLSGAAFAGRMAAPWLAAVVVTAAVVAVACRGELVRLPAPRSPDDRRPVVGVGAAACVGAAVAVLVLPQPAPVVAAIGLASVAWRTRRGRDAVGAAWRAMGVPTLVGLFGIAVALGTIGRLWDGPARLLGHLDPWATGGVAALAATAVNNLPAASLLSARPPTHPFALLAGLDIGPNLFLTGSLAWLLWLRAARASGAHVSVRRAALLGVGSAPPALAAALALLTATGLR